MSVASGRGALIALATAFLAGCSLAPAYHVPETVTPATFKEVGVWVKAAPQDSLPRGAWWKVYDDPVLDGLESRFERESPELAAALQRYDEARAYVAEAEAGLYPTIGADWNPTRDRQSNNRPLRGANEPDVYTSDTLGSSVDYEIDLWGSVRNTVAAGKARQQAASALLADARLSLQTDLANDYASLRGLDAQLQLLNGTVTAYQRAYDLVVLRHSGGIASGVDLGRATMQLHAARAQRSGVVGQRALYEHAIATLVGEPASNFSLAPAPAVMKVPNVPVGLPSTLLERRPDVAADEREVAAANAEIGVARAAFYPNITLAGALGVQNTGGPGLLSAPNLFWSIGPNVAMTFFEGGLRHAQLDLAKAEKNVAADTYRADVLQAFQDVEDNLALLHHLADASADQSLAVTAARRTQDLAFARYRLGAVNYLEVVIAQTAALEAQQTALDLDTQRVEASIRLIKAVGGGWTTDDLPHLASNDPAITAVPAAQAAQAGK
ncbi:MAG TPA: efflux transporter outer membrane subunit [Rhizomicrobium sp.]|jgi:NodT family efflux transporter outer membrane factor (OMF) lipoprotein|nr:efflux transporter outer membrane subunit [Rhizomicrobium sp.]